LRRYSLAVSDLGSVLLGSVKQRLNSAMITQHAAIQSLFHNRQRCIQLRERNSDEHDCVCANQYLLRHGNVGMLFDSGGFGAMPSMLAEKCCLICLPSELMAFCRLIGRPMSWQSLHAEKYDTVPYAWFPYPYYARKKAGVGGYFSGTVA
jgi:hypothetical protein